MKRRDFLKTGLKIGVAANTLPMLLGGMPIRALGRSPLGTGWKRSERRTTMCSSSSSFRAGTMG